MTKSDEFLFSKLLEFWEAMDAVERGDNIHIDYWLDYLDGYAEALKDMESKTND